jgi:hypothetical protein
MSFPLCPGASFRSQLEEALHLYEPPSLPSTKSLSPSWFGAMQNESVSHMPGIKSTLWVTEIKATCDQDIQTCLDQQVLCLCPEQVPCHYIHEKARIVCPEVSLGAVDCWDTGLRAC